MVVTRACDPMTRHAMPALPLLLFQLTHHADNSVKKIGF